MSCRRGTIAISEALRHVFMPRVSSCGLSRPAASLVHRGSNIASFTTRHETTPIDPKKFGPADYVTQVKDEGIAASIVYLRDEKGNLGQPQYKPDVLKSFDRKEYFLVQLAKDDSGTPICRIVPRAELYAKEKASNAKSMSSRDTKEIEIPWKSAEGDVDRKLRNAFDLLEKGKQVDVVLIARRPREIVQDKAEAQAIVDRVYEKITSIEGLKGTFDPAGRLGKVTTIHLEAPPRRKPAKTEPGRNAKVIEVVWAATDDEIQKKQWRIEQLLTSKIPVDLVVTSKKKAFEISEQDGDVVLKKIWTKLRTIPGIREVEPREGTPGKTVTLYLGSNPAH